MPTDLGLTLWRGYRAIDPELASPTIRSRVEKQLDLVASGEAEHASVVAHVLRQFAEKYANFVGAVDRMDPVRGALRSRLGARRERSASAADAPDTSPSSARVGNACTARRRKRRSNCPRDWSNSTTAESAACAASNSYSARRATASIRCARTATTTRRSRAGQPREASWAGARIRPSTLRWTDSACVPAPSATRRSARVSSSNPWADLDGNSCVPGAR